MFANAATPLQCRKVGAVCIEVGYRVTLVFIPLLARIPYE